MVLGECVQNALGMLILCRNEPHLFSAIQNPSEYLYWDQVHLTEAMNRFLANDIFGGSSYVFPQNMVQAFILPQLLNLGR